MNNPNGPYPGRQLFLGLTSDGRPSLAYLVTGRSPPSRERRAVQKENSVIIGPIGNQPYDPLRHYTAVKFDDASGIAVVSNGIQTEAIFEAYKLLANVESTPTEKYMETLLYGAGAEPDSLHTPRIAGVITDNNQDEINPVYFIGIKEHQLPAKAIIMKPKPSILTGISTYKGGMDNPEPFDIDSNLPTLEFNGKTAEELAEYLYDISETSCQGDDIRVCSIGGIYFVEHGVEHGTWDLSIKNRRE